MPPPLAEIAKYVGYRLPARLGVTSPRYRLKIDPGEMAALIGLIEMSSAADGAIVEFGVAQGQTSACILEHLRSTGDHRVPTFIDTFDGFTEESVEVEVEARRKQPRAFESFRYGSRRIFESKLRALGYDDFEVVVADASKFDWASIGPLGAVLLDIDVYGPTLAVLEQTYEQLAPGGGMVVDDCVPNTPWDGALQAYTEFTSRRGITKLRVGGKGGLLLAPGSDVPPYARRWDDS